MAVPELSAHVVRPHSPLERFLLCGFGLVIAVGGWGAGLLLLGASREEPGRVALPTLLVVLLLLWGIGAYGAWLVARGLKGRSRVTVLDRASDSFARALTELTVPLSMAFGAAVWSAGGGHAPLAVLPGAVWCLFVGAVGFPLWIALHELGHLVAATVQGRRLMEVRAWPLRLARAPDGALRAAVFWRLRDGRAGLVLAFPPAAGRWADRVFIFGGPLASALVSISLFRAAGPWTAAVTAGGMPTLLLAGGVFNGLLAVANIVPSKTLTGEPNDGLLLLRTLTPRSAEDLLQNRIAALALSQRPRDWNVGTAEFETAAHSAKVPETRSWLLLFGASVALDSGERAEAARLLSLGSAVEGASGAVKREVLLQRAMAAALLDSDPLSARAELAGAISLGTADGYTDLALSAVLFSEGAHADAVAALARWRRAATGWWAAGNQWALERLDLVLAVPTAGAQPSAGSCQMR